MLNKYQQNLSLSITLIQQIEQPLKLQLVQGGYEMPQVQSYLLPMHILQLISFINLNLHRNPCGCSCRKCKGARGSVQSCHMSTWIQTLEHWHDTYIQQLIVYYFILWQSLCYSNEIYYCRNSFYLWTDHQEN